jgi:predicted Zn finger-like uncharacterized protein
MSMVTQCPSCLTTFRVTPQQLQAHHGMVRCGRCSTVFDGFKSLGKLPDESAAPAPEPISAEDRHAPPGETAAPQEPETATNVDAERPREAQIEDEQRDDVEAPQPPDESEHPADESMHRADNEKNEVLAPSEPPVSEALASTEELKHDVPDGQDSAALADGAVPPSGVSADAPQQADPAPLPADVTAPDRIDVTPVLRAKPPARKLREEEASEESNFQFPEQPKPSRNIGWRVGATLLLVVLALQGVYLFRSEIAASVPELRPALSKVCETLRCTVPLPQRPRQISIEASDMQAIDPTNPGHITLTATLRNHASIELAYPALDVVLTNAKEHTVARRIFMPEEYLAGQRNPAAGMRPNAEFTIRLELDTGELGAAGFRLDLLPAA